MRSSEVRVPSRTDDQVLIAGTEGSRTILIKLTSNVKNIYTSQISLEKTTVIDRQPEALLIKVSVTDTTKQIKYLLSFFNSKGRIHKGKLTPLKTALVPTTTKSHAEEIQ
ncbi:unnamed protein product [Candidula unifasciata]|uniref:Uncharacterized protein n=1 Tax=Candidula unifasciata TaxID=100452 RepID=A0A8S3ZN01_9EUPU|nr:unnamed protein product [Candidula unifasciata]